MTNRLDSGRGYAVLLVYEKFKHVNNRKGAEKDFENMKYITESMGLEQINQGNEKNLTRDETLKVLEDARNSLITKDDCQMFVFMISTHGEESANNAAAGQKDHALVCSDDKKIFLSTDVVKRFSDHNCPVLKGKPKLFFIQACRSVHHTWYMEKGTKLINIDAIISINPDKTTITVARDKDNNYETKQSIDVQDIAQIHTSKSSDNIKESKEFHLVLKGGKGKEEFIASTQDHADAWVIGLCDLMLPNNNVSSVLAKRIWMDGKEENGHVRFQKNLNGILWDYCSSDVTGVAGGAGSQTSADLLTMERENKDETEADTTGRYDNETKVLGFTQPLQDMNINTGTDDVILSCKTNCPNVKWEKDGKPIESTTRVKIEQTGFVHQLKFTKFENGDSGLYTCSISKNCSTSSSLNVGGFTKPLQDKYIKTRTKDAILSCETNCPNVKWEKDGKPIESTTRVKIGPKYFIHQLTFTKVDCCDSGHYMCTSGDLSTGILLIEGGLTKRLQNKYLDAGTENITLSCTTNSDKVKWKKDDKPIESTSRIRIEPIGFLHRLIITKAEYGDSGKYVCNTSEGWSTESTLIVGEFLAPKKLSWSESKNVFTIKCSDESDIKFQTNFLEENAKGDDWFNTLTYVMHFPSYGKDEGVSVKQTMNPTDTKSGEQTKRNETDTLRLLIQERGDGSIVHPKQAGSLGTVQENNPKDPIPRLMKCDRDTLMMFAVPTGRPAYRNIKTGSWLFACIKEALEKQKQNDEPVNLMSVLTAATGLIAEMETKDIFNTYKAVPVIDHQLLRKLTVKVNI